MCIRDRGSNEPVSEAQGMYEDLVKKGIDPKRLILEDQSTNLSLIHISDSRQHGGLLYPEGYLRSGAFL